MLSFSGGLCLQEMLEVLVEVTVQWFMLGIYLGIPSETLQTIRATKRKVEVRKTHMLIKWSEQDTPTWEKLVEALMKMKLYILAVNIATKYRE